MWSEAQSRFEPCDFKRHARPRSACQARPCLVEFIKSAFQASIVKAHLIRPCQTPVRLLRHSSANLAQMCIQAQDLAHMHGPGTRYEAPSKIVCMITDHVILIILRIWDLGHPEADTFVRGKRKSSTTSC